MDENAYYLCYLDHQLKLQPGKSYTIGRTECEVVLPNHMVSRRHARIEWEQAFPCIVDLNSTNGTQVNARPVTRTRLFPGDKIEIGNAVLKLLAVTNNLDHTMKLSDTVMLEARVATLLHDIKDPELANKITDLKSLFNKKNQALTRIAYRDALTKVYNRRYFDLTLAEEIERAQRYQRGLHLILIDIDHFKRFNDEYGHRKGDEVLALVAQTIEKNSRSNDTVCRYGGEELAVIVPESTITTAQTAAEKIRRTIEVRSVALAGVKVTASFGVAGLNDVTRSASELIEAADRALYQAKRAGRNRVAIATRQDTLA